MPAYRFPDISRRRALIAAAAGAAVSIGAIAALGQEGPPKAGFAPDPPNLPTNKQWVFDVSFKNKRITVEKVKSGTVDPPIGTARVMGRFAIELYIGKELLDRIRFNFPLTAEGPPDKARRPFARPTFDDVVTRMRVQMSDSPRATYVAIVDRATGETQRFWWPPEPNGSLLPMTTPTSDGGKPDAKPSGSDASLDR